MTVLANYLSQLEGQAPDAGAAAYYAALDAVAAGSPGVARSIVSELRDQRRHVKLIASENYSSLATQLAHGNLLTDKYAEGYAGHRFYAGCDNVDQIETEACDLAKQLFGAKHAYVQPHSGATANLVAFTAILSARVEHPFLDGRSVFELEREDWTKLRDTVHRQRLLAMDLSSGGHLTHGYRLNVSSQLFDSHTYSVDPETHLLDLDHVRARVQEVEPLVLIAGYSAYSRKLNFAKLREIAEAAGAVLMVDMAHFAGLVAGKVFTGDYDPVAHAHIVTSTTHKTLRGPRGGIVLCQDELAEFVDKGCPNVLGGPLPHAMAAKAVAFREALKPEFRDYSAKIVENAQALAAGLLERDLPVLTGGTDNHIVLVNVAQAGDLNGRQAESALRECGLTLNRNAVPPADPNGPWYTSGLRFGTPAVTTLGMGPAEMDELADLIALVLKSTAPKTLTKGKNAGKASKAKYVLDDAVKVQARERVEALLSRFPLYPELDLGLLEGADWASA